MLHETPRAPLTPSALDLLYSACCGALWAQTKHTTFQSESNIKPGKLIVSAGWVLLPHTHTPVKKCDELVDFELCCGT